MSRRLPHRQWEGGGGLEMGSGGLLQAGVTDHRSHFENCISVGPSAPKCLMAAASPAQPWREERLGPLPDIGVWVWSVKSNRAGAGVGPLFTHSPNFGGALGELVYQHSLNWSIETSLCRYSFPQTLPLHGLALVRAKHRPYSATTV